MLPCLGFFVLLGYSVVAVDISALVPSHLVAGRPRVSTDPIIFSKHLPATNTNMHYNVTHSDNVISLEHTGLRTALCKPDGVLLLVFGNTTAAAEFLQLEPLWTKTGILVGGLHFGCVQNSTNVPVSVRMSKTTTFQANGSVVTFGGLQKAEIHHVLKHAKVSISHPMVQAEPQDDCPEACTTCLSKPSSDCVEACRNCPVDCVKCVTGGKGAECVDTCKPSTCPDACGHCVRSGGGDDCLESCKPCGDDCNTCISSNGGTGCDSYCESKAEATQCNIGLVVTGKCDYTSAGNTSYPNAGFDFDYSGKTLVDDGPLKIACFSCNAKFVPTVTLDLEIDNNSLVSAGVSVTGTWSNNIQPSITLSSSYSYNDTIQAETIVIPTITFWVGAFPIPITTKFPLAMGVQLVASGSITVSFVLCTTSSTSNFVTLLVRKCLFMQA